MEIHKTELERAFEIARSGKCPDMTSLLRQLKTERYSGIQIEGKALKSQLTLLIQNATRGNSANS